MTPDLDLLKEYADLMRQGDAVFCPDVLDESILHHQIDAEIITDLRTRLAALEQAGVTEIERLKRIEVAARNVANTLNGGFIVCQHCGEQETTTDMDYASELYAALAPAPIPQGGERYRHVKRGTEYEVIGTAELQMSRDLVDGSSLVIYRGDDGKLWAREEGEFHDGRFIALQPPAGDA